MKTFPTYRPGDRIVRTIDNERAEIVMVDDSSVYVVTDAGDLRWWHGLSTMRHENPEDVVVRDVLDERERQTAKWGEQNHPDGTGPSTVPMPNAVGFLNAHELATAAKTMTDLLASLNMVSWQHILLEEVFEAFAEDDPAKLRAELVQVAAVAVQWVEAIDRRPALPLLIGFDGSPHASVVVREVEADCGA